MSLKTKKTHGVCGYKGPHMRRKTKVGYHYTWPPLPGTHFSGDLVSLSASQDTKELRKISHLSASWD